VFNNTDAAAARAGAFGGSGWAESQSENARRMSEESGKAASALRFGDYTNQQNMWEQDAQRNGGLTNQLLLGNLQAKLSGAGMLGNLTDTRYGDAAMVGDDKRGYLQSLIGENMGNWNQQQGWGQMQNSALGNAIGAMGQGNWFGKSKSESKSSTSGGGGSPFGSIASGLLGLAAAPFTGGSSLLGTAASAASGLASAFGGSTSGGTNFGAYGSAIPTMSGYGFGNWN
jgi:hypothetical protein